MKRRTEPLFSEFDPPQDFLSKTVTNNAAPSASNDFRSFDKIASSLLAEKRFAEAETHSLQLIELCLQGLRYYQT